MRLIQNTPPSASTISPVTTLTAGNKTLQPQPDKTATRIKFEAFALAVDLTPIKYKLIKESSWTRARADAVEPQYKAFLFLIGNRCGHLLVPTRDIDEMWHTHILDTRKYMADCARHFGEYIHHYPYLGLKDDADKARAEQLFTTTSALILDTLDIAIHKNEAADCGGCSGGSSCSGSSCSSDGGGGGGGNNSGDSGGGFDIGGCSSGDSSSERRDKSKPGTSRPKERKRGIFSRILGLSGKNRFEKWYASVTPEFFPTEDFRPGSVDLERMTNKTLLH